MKVRKYETTSSKALSVQKLLELNGFRIVSWTVKTGRKIVIEYK